MKKTVCTMALIFVLLFSLIIPIFFINSVEAETNLSGIISSDTTWTKTNSPYSLTGNVLIDNGVKLVIQAGTTVNVNDYYIRVNGSLIIEPNVIVNMGNPPNHSPSIQVNGLMTVRGTSTDPIHFNGGQITYSSLSVAWDEQKKTGDIIEYSIFNSTEILAANNIRLDHNLLNTVGVVQGIITNNNITGTVTVSGSTLVSDNLLTGGSIYSSWGDLSNGYPTITNNTITGSQYGISVSGGYALISNNIIFNCQRGISAFSVVIFGGQTVPYALIQNNLIVNNDYGIVIDVFSRFDTGNLTALTISNNTISNNTIGFSIRELAFGSGPTILNNNIENNSNYSMLLAPDTKNNVDATFNWWGTADQQAINQSIYDFKNDFNLGKVNFNPFLTAPNSNAPQIPEFSSSILSLFMIVTLTVTMLTFKKRKNII